MTINANIIVQTIDESKRALNTIERKERRILIRTGSFGRTVMRRQFRRRKKSSEPGNPPHAHAPKSSGLKDVRYAVSAVDGSVTIGHIKYPRLRKRPDKFGRVTSFTSSKPLPQLMNEGGGVTYELEHPNPNRNKKLALNYAPRPFRDRAFPPINAFFRKLIAKERL